MHQLHTDESLSSAALSLSTSLAAFTPAALTAATDRRAPLRREVVVPAELDDGARRRLTDELYAAHRRIFTGVGRAAFARYVVDSPADRTAIAVFRDDRDRVVGYLAFHEFERDVDGRPVIVIRAEAGIDRRHRGANIATPFFIDRLVRVLLAARGRPIYYLGSLVHPSSYAQFARYADRVWPNPEVETPAPLRRLMDRLAGEFGLERVDPADTLVREVGWRTREFAGDDDHWRNHGGDAVRFFLAHNPDYGAGHGLLTLIPISASVLLRGLLRFAAGRLRRRLSALAAGLGRLAGRAPVSRALRR